jgi:succinoglycan biosynthesis transport protein ExoP
LFAGGLLVWTVGGLLPSIYRSGTLILVQQPAVSKIVVGAAVDSDLQERLDSIQQQVLSRSRLLYVIHRLNLYPEERTRLGPDALVDRMRKNIQIELVRSPGKNQLTAFNIFFEAEDPRVAQAVTTELTDLLIRENLQAGQESAEDTTRFLESQLEDARKTLAGQEEKVRLFKDRYLGELPGQLSSNLQILGGLQAQLQSEQDALGRANQQKAYLQSLVAQYQSAARSMRPGGGETNAVGLPAIDQELDRLRTQLADLSSRYTDKYPDVIKLKDRIAKTEKMKRQLTAELKATAAQGSASGSDSASDYAGKEMSPLMEVQSQLKGNQIEITNRQRSIAELENKISEYQARLNRTPVREQELADLTRDQDQSRTNYDSLLAKKNQSQLTANLNKSQEGLQFRIVDPPSLPTKPYSPNRLKLCFGGLAAGVVLGLASTVGSELLDDRVYDEKAFQDLISADVMVEIPPLPTAQEQAGDRHRRWKEFGAVAGMSILILAGVALSFLHG